MTTVTIPDLVQIAATTLDDGPIGLGAAVSGFRGIEALTDGATYHYSITQAGDYEYGEGVYDETAGTLARDVFESSNGGAPLVLRSGATVSFVALAVDFAGGTVGPNLQAIDAQTTSADTLTYWTGSATTGLTALTGFGRTVIGATDQGAGRTALGLGTLATQNGTFSGSSSGTNTGDQTSVTGNAGTATTLQTARTINGVSFNGSANITVPAVDTATPRLAAANNLSDVVSASTARTNLGLGTMATQAATAVAITGGTITMPVYGVTRAALDGGGNGAQVIFDSPAPTPQTDSLGANNAVASRLVATTGKITDGGGFYYDDVFAFGSNLGIGFLPVNTAMPCTSIRIESQFRQSGASIFGAEVHVGAHVPVGAPGSTEWRAISIFMPKNYADRDSAEYIQSYQANGFVYLDSQQRPRRQVVYAANGASAETFASIGGNNYAFNFEQNGSPFMFQLNATLDALLPLPYYGPDNNQRVGGAIVTNDLANANSNGNHALYDVTANNIASGSYYRIVSPASTLTTDFWGDKLSGYTTANFIQEFRNYAPGGSLIQRLNGQARSFVSFSDEISKVWAVGVDFTADTYSICAANEDLTSNKALVVKRTDQRVRLPALVADNFANDAAAAAGGVAVGGLYHTAGAVKVRLT